MAIAQGHLDSRPHSASLYLPSDRNFIRFQGISTKNIIKNSYIVINYNHIWTSVRKFCITDFEILQG